MADRVDRFEALEQQLELFIENTRQLGIIVSDFQPQGQNVLNQKFYIDQGKNPNLYTKDCLEKALVKNEQVKGKIDNFKRFKGMLLVELEKSFPIVINNYRALRSDDRPT
ncbi:hypothetical protein KUTeg_019092 [Tegillarca granosa]|uniref:Mediator of RNA polymerase II transcription subunit 10 n=1 Tax=Tegillarca granosa TaxID=220873 RepID=A0ABQ9EFS3_TEGGR|nr:hypothetical protein KUTeg_019092 [Tegillarca granosa]